MRAKRRWYARGALREARDAVLCVSVGNVTPKRTRHAQKEGERLDGAFECCFKGIFTVYFVFCAFFVQIYASRGIRFSLEKRRIQLRKRSQHQDLRILRLLGCVWVCLCVLFAGWSSGSVVRMAVVAIVWFVGRCWWFAGGMKEETLKAKERNAALLLAR